ncbi:Uncharacterized protein SAPIO_CDS2655 [Scedosporium apiospermum]|uniref:Uncharacterized protein n=1 Tax=Pseudallescheria apiosperma TaxID=563466 RepID=A0A084GCY5_PSEDA|nr:Uncharacterized protein SAPIO_CDS2655 [Scedosporium apiospermum]KEZ45197.1 Uncharacterized protein SAPIO_CDS2655 [Scedosporium apiospermum]
MDDESPTKRDTAHSTPSTPAADDTIRVGDRQANGDKKIKKEGGRGGEDEADAAADTRPKYRSWKKKWRKLRVTFDHKMREAEVLWLSEQRAKATIKRIAIENDRLLDLLTDINECPQVPPEKRISVPTLTLPTESPDSPSTTPSKSLSSLESEVPHLSYDQAKDSLPDTLQDITPAAGEDDPATFLTVDEIENYLYETDLRLGLPKQNSLAPAAKDGATLPATSTTSAGLPPSSTTRDFLIKYPHSAYNWLKSNASHVFLQGGESAAAHHHDDDESHHPPASAARKKGASKASAAEKSSKPSSKASSSKRQSKADRILAEQQHQHDLSMGEDDDYATPAAAKKRKRDDDGGYRPKGGSSSRPSKKKRKSDVEGTPLAGKKRKVAAEE